MKRSIVVIMSDTHANHRLGLLSPDTILYEEDPKTRELLPWSPNLGPIQRWLWDDCYTIDIPGVVDLARGDRIVLVHDGDMCQGGNGNGRELVSGRIADQFIIAAENLRPWFDLPNLERAIFVKGTGYHELGQGSAALIVAQDLASYGIPIDVPYHAEAVIDGVTFDLAHHGPPPGVRSWLRGNILRLYTQSLMDRALMEGRIPPDVMVRGHYHELTSEIVSRRARGRRWETRAVILPSYCGLDEYARKVTKSPPDLTIGLLAFEIVDGRVVEMYEFVRTVDFRTRMVI